MTEIRAIALVCSLKPSPAPSSSELIAEHVSETLRKEGAEYESLRCVDFHIAPGVEADMGDSDQWPMIREKVMAADILLLSTPVWLGHPSSVAQRVLERLDAELSNTDDQGRPAMAGKVALVSVVGNEDGAHKVVADVFQGLNDVGYSIPAQGVHLLERSGNGERRLQGSGRGARAGGVDHRRRGAQCRPPGAGAEAVSVPGVPIAR